MKKTLLFFSVLLFAILVIWILFVVSQPKPSSNFSDEILLQAITKKYPAFIYKGEPTIKISTVSVHEGKWYIVSIASRRSVKSPVPVRVVLVNSSSVENPNLIVVLGPDTHFSESAMVSSNLPDSVIMELQKS